MLVPFLRPKVVPAESYLPRLHASDAVRWYSNMGPHVIEFERRVVNELLGGVGSAAAVCNATLGLMLAIAALKRNGRFAIMPSFTFAATPLAARWCGLTPYFVDVRRGDWCPDEDAIEQAVAELGDEAAVIITYATFGAGMPLERYERWQLNGVPVVIDAAPCLGTQTVDGPFAAGFPGAVVYSLHATKAFSVGEGGLVYSANEQLVEQIRRMACFGFDGARECTQLGLNAKMPEVSAAIALATLDAFPAKLAVRQHLYAAYAQALAAQGLLQRGWELQRFAGFVPHQFMPLLCPPHLRNDRVIEELAALQVGARSYFSPACHLQQHFIGCPHGPLTVTEDLDRRVVSLPLWEEMTLSEIDHVVAALAVITQRNEQPSAELASAA